MGKSAAASRKFKKKSRNADKSLENAFDVVKRDVAKTLNAPKVSSNECSNVNEDTIGLTLTSDRGRTHIDTDSADTAILLEKIKALLVSSAENSSNATEDAFSFDQMDEEGMSKRRKWLAIRKELQHVQGLASWAVQSTSSDAQSRMLKSLRHSIVAAAHFLIEGSDLSINEPINNVKSSNEQYGGAGHFSWLQALGGHNGGEESKHSSQANFSKRQDRLLVWTSPQAARCAIIQEAIAISNMQPASLALPSTQVDPLVIVVMERASDPNATSNSISFEGGDVDTGEGEAFLSAWTRASFGLAKVVTVSAGSSSQLYLALENVLKRVAGEPTLPPVLVNLYASSHSMLSSSMSSLRQLCDAHNTRLCVEGPGLALIAQSSRPSDPDECAKYAHVLLLDPGSWFGFKICAVLSKHNLTLATKGGICDNDQSSSPCSQHHFADEIDEQHGLPAVPLLNLWTVLSRIGLHSMRSMVDSATALSERFVHGFAMSTNIETAYDGIGCIVRFSYTMSSEDRLKQKYKGRDHVSRVNLAMYSHLKEESKALLVYPYRSDNRVYLQFSPARLLRSGTLWIPCEETVQAYTEKMQQGVDKYEACVAGAASFNQKIASCSDVQAVDHMDVTSGISLCYGAFRIVPHEIRESWLEKDSSLETVSNLTNSLISEICISLDKLQSLEHSLTQRWKKAKLLAKNKQTELLDSSVSESTLLDKHAGNRDEADLPFSIYLLSDTDGTVPEYLSVEPKGSCRPVKAVRDAELAAEVLITAVEKIASEWRSSKQAPSIPIHLANVCGIEQFDSVTPTCGRLRNIQQEEQSEKDLGTEEYLQDSNSQQDGQVEHDCMEKSSQDVVAEDLDWGSPNVSESEDSIDTRSLILVSSTAPNAAQSVNTALSSTHSKETSAIVQTEIVNLSAHNSSTTEVEAAEGLLSVEGGDSVINQDGASLAEHSLLLGSTSPAGSMSELSIHRTNTEVSAKTRSGWFSFWGSRRERDDISDNVKRNENENGEAIEAAPSECIGGATSTAMDSSEDESSQSALISNDENPESNDDTREVDGIGSEGSGTSSNEEIRDEVLYSENVQESVSDSDSGTGRLKASERESILRSHPPGRLIAWIRGGGTTHVSDLESESQSLSREESEFTEGEAGGYEVLPEELSVHGATSSGSGHERGSESPEGYISTQESQDSSSEESILKSCSETESEDCDDNRESVIPLPKSDVAVPTGPSVFGFNWLKNRQQRARAEQLRDEHSSEASASLSSSHSSLSSHSTESEGLSELSGPTHMAQKAGDDGSTDSYYFDSGGSQRYDSELEFNEENEGGEEYDSEDELGESDSGSDESDVERDDAESSGRKPCSSEDESTTSVDRECATDVDSGTKGSFSGYGAWFLRSSQSSKERVETSKKENLKEAGATSSKTRRRTRLQEPMPETQDWRINFGWAKKGPRYKGSSRKSKTRQN